MVRLTLSTARTSPKRLVAESMAMAGGADEVFIPQVCSFAAQRGTAINHDLTMTNVMGCNLGMLARRCQAALSQAMSMKPYGGSQVEGLSWVMGGLVGTV